MKFVNEFGLREGCQAEYRRRHDAIWPEMREMMTRAGLKNYSICNRGSRLIEYYECADIGRALAIISSSPVKAKWDAYMQDILLFEEDGNASPLECMFDFNSTERSES